MMGALFVFALCRPSVRGLLFLGALYPNFLPAESADHEQAAQRIQVLRRQIAYHDELYFNKAEPEIPDALYDALVRELEDLESNGPSPPLILQDEDGPATTCRRSRLERGFHNVPMLSLRKIHNEGQWNQYLDTIQAHLPGQEVCWQLEPKVDGIAISLVYLDGKFQCALTRGNGDEGEDITAHVLATGKVPLVLQSEEAIPEYLELRGELFVPLSRLKAVNRERVQDGGDPYSTARTCAAATVQLADPQAVRERGLEWVVFGWGRWSPSTGAPADAIAFTLWLRNNGFATVPVLGRFERKRLTWEALQESQSRLVALDWPCDGIVVKISDVDQRRRLGSSKAWPNWAVACKPAGPSAQTTVLGIDFSIGRTGVLTPRLRVDPVDINGREITSVNLVTAGILQALDIRRGDTLCLQLSGDVIPVVGSLSKKKKRPSDISPIPLKCPLCEGATRFDSASGKLYCMNRNCRKRRAMELLYFATTVGITGVGPATIEKLMESGLLLDFADYYELEQKRMPIKDLLGENTCSRLLENIEFSRISPMEQFIQGIGIPGVGRVTAAKIGECIGSLDELVLISSGTELCLGDLLGQEAMGSLRSFVGIPANRALLERLAQSVSPPLDRRDSSVQ